MDLVHSQVPEPIQDGHSTGDRNRTCDLLVQSQTQRPTVATPEFRFPTSSGRRIRTFTSLLNREVPYQFGYTGIYKSGWSDSNRRSRAHEARGIIKLSNTLLTQSAQRESNSQFLLGKEVGYHYTMDAFVGSTELSKIRAPSENRTHVATLRGRRHSTRPSVLFHSVGPEGIEPSTFVL